MPKAKRKLYSSAEETLVLEDYDTSQTTSASFNSSLTRAISPDHTEESNEVAQITSACGQQTFRLSPLHSQSFSAELKLAFPFTPKGDGDFNTLDGNTPAFECFPCPPAKKLCSLDKSPTKNKIQGVQEAMTVESTNTCAKEKHIVGQKNVTDSSISQEDRKKILCEQSARAESIQSLDGSSIGAEDTTSTETSTQAAVGGDQPQEHNNLRAGSKPQPVDSAASGTKSEQAERSTCTMAGYMTLAARNGDSMVHGMLPPLLPHGSPIQSLSPCIPGNDCSWYQILSTVLPPVPSNQHPANSGETGPAAVPSSSDSSSFSVCGAAPVGSSAPVSASTPSSISGNNTPGAGASLVNDPLVTLITAGTVDMQHPFQALRLPVSMATSTPRYLYASHPRKGQLVLLSPVGDLNAISSLQQHLQQHHQQPSHLHQEQGMPAVQLPPPQQLSQVNNQHQQQISQQKIKSPLQANQQSNAQVAMVSAILAKQLTSSSILSTTGQTKTKENMAPVAAARELLALASPACSKQPTSVCVLPPLMKTSAGVSDDEPVRENHNMKERRRRARIKEACDLMRQLVPGMSDKTDKATVFEFSARYIHFLKNFVGGHHDKEFLIKYSPY